ncbi:MAG: hypothetical protein HC924_17345 [Synechococcaceae cyanobacterium SM2_3_2]|nr:hypothetical protein [Synechococcaceae cyanobacterium SM2_3_2]
MALAQYQGLVSDSALAQCQGSVSDSDLAQCRGSLWELAKCQGSAWRWVWAGLDQVEGLKSVAVVAPEPAHDKIDPIDYLLEDNKAGSGLL